MSSITSSRNQAPVVNWLGNWASNENLNNTGNFVKASSINRQIGNNSPNPSIKQLKFYIDINGQNLPPASKKLHHSVSSRCNTSMSPTTHMRSLCSHHHATPITIQRAASSVAVSVSNPYKATIIQPNQSGFSSIPSSRRGSINSPRSFTASTRPESPFTTIEMVSIGQNAQPSLKDRSLSRAKYEDFRNQRATRSYTPTVINVTSNRSNPYQGGVSIILSKRNLKVYYLI